MMILEEGEPLTLVGRGTAEKEKRKKKRWSQLHRI